MKDKNGKPKKKRVKADKYTIKYKNEHGKWVTAPGSRSYDLSRKKAAHIEHEVDCIRRGLVDPFEAPKKQPLVNHLQGFSNHLAAKENSVKHIKITMNRVVNTFIACEFKKLDDLVKFDARGKVEDYLSARRRGGLSAVTSNHYLTAAKSFCNWAAKDNRIPQSPILLIEKIPETDDKRERRSATADQFADVIEAAYNGPTTHQMTGEQRAWFYMTATNGTVDCCVRETSVDEVRYFS